MRKISDSFGSELQSAGLLGLPFSWTADGEFNFSDAMTDLQKTAVLAVYEAHNPDAPEPAPTQDQRVALLLAARGLTLDSEWQLYAAIAGMQAAGAVSGKTEAQIYASNPGYKNAKDLFLAVAAIRAEA